VLDVVYNHLGPDGNHLAEFGPYFTDRHRTPWGAAVNLDGPGSDEVRAFFLDNARMWLRDYHLDGLRLDAVHAIVDTSATHFLEALVTAVEALGAALGRTLWVVAESDLNDPRVVRSREAGGLGLHAQWSDDFHHALHALLTGERTGYYEDFGTLADLATALRRAFVYAGRRSRHRGRRHGRPATGLPGTRFLGYSQNHDQVGNRARGERSAALVSVGKLEIAAALVLTSPFVPLLFAGEEWGASTPFLYFTDHDDPALADAVRDGRRREFAAFGWRPEDVPDPQAPETFLRSKLLWEERARPPHARLLAWYRRLVALRRATPALTDGRLDAVRVRFNERAGWLAIGRGELTVATNPTAVPVRVPLPRADVSLLLASDDACRLADGAVALPPETVAIVG
jgi:maltooligosyltrehalose trehalohydrolase